MRAETFVKSLCAAVLLCRCVGAPATESGTRLLRQPAVSKDHLAFVYGGDLWRGAAPDQEITGPAERLA